MSSSLGEKPPATPDNQTLGDSGDGASPPMPPPPPFNTPSGVSTSSAFPTALEASSAVAEDGSAAAVADKLLGLSIRDEDEGGEGAGGVIDDGEGGEDDSEDDEDGEENEVELPREVMKRLYQLKALQSEKDVIYDQYKVERADLERKFSALYGGVYSRRTEVVAGRARNIDGSESDATMEDEAGESGVPHFWMQCMLHHEALHDVVCEPDLEALYYLADVRCVDKDNLLGFTLDFHFDDNPYFSNAVLTKRYHTANIMDQGEPLLEGVEGTPIAWKAGRNLCERTIRRKVKRGGSRSGGGGETRTVTKSEKTESFFKFFQNPVMYDEDDEDDEDEYNFSYDMDYEVALIFRNHLIPNAVLWFTGEAVSEDDEDMDDDDEGDDDDGLENAGGFSGGGGDTPPDEEGSEAGEDEESGSAKGSSPKMLSFEAPAGFEAPPSGSVDGKECKQS